MQEVSGNTGAAYMECVNPKKDKWKIRWAIADNGDGTAVWMEEDFSHKPTADEIRDTVIGWYNDKIDNKILSGFVWNGKAVWLSTENQFNYKAAYDLAVQTQGANLPVTFKLGTDDVPEYYEFSNVEELGDFYTKAMAYVQGVLANGWQEKDTFDISKYVADE